MRRRLRNYVAVVMSLLLCMGLWFQHGQMVKAADETSATVIISTGESEVLNLEGVSVKGFSSVTTGDMKTYIGSLSLTQEQIEAVDTDNRYLVYWFATDDLVDTIATGTSPTIDLSMLYPGYITCEEITDEAGSVTYNDLTIRLYARYGEEHYVTYYSNEAQDGDHTSDTYEEVYYYQSDPDELGGAYNHPETATINGKVITNGNNFFVGWSTTDSGAVGTPPSEFQYTDNPLRLYARWQEAACLTITYIPSENSEGYDNYAYQQTLTDTTFSFVTEAEPSPPTDYSVFEGWSYTNASGATVMIGAGETCSDIPITTTTVTLTAVWKEPLQSGSTVSAGTHTLLAGEPYTLGSGLWTVTYGGNGDSCTYTGGSTFYVTSTGDYTFAAK